MDERLEGIRQQLPGITSTLDAKALDDAVEQVIDKACVAAEMAVINAEGALMAARALGRRAFTEHSPVLDSVRFRELVQDV